MPRPDFIVIGAQKSGTTWLFDKLTQHPAVAMPAREVHFFNLASNWAKGPGWYEAQLPDAAPGGIVGEKTPNYLWVTDDERHSRGLTHLPDIPARMHDVVPDARLVAVLRDPVQRAVAAVNHYRRQGELSPDTELDDLLFGAGRGEADALGVLDMGRYARQLRRYLDHFPTEQLLVLVFEDDVVADPAAGLARSCAFLGIDPDIDWPEARRNEFKARNVRIARALHRFPAQRDRIVQLDRRLPGASSPWRSRLLGPPVDKLRASEATLDRLAEFYAADNAALAELLDRPLDAWRGAPGGTG